MQGFSARLIEKSHKMIFDNEFVNEFKASKNCFTRKRCMGFTGIFTLCLNFIKKSLQIEIDNYMELTDPEIEKPITKQAFSKARQNISPDAFKTLFEMTGKTALEEDAFGRYNGYRVFAVDGTELQLPKTPELTSKFTQTRGSFSPHARASILCDVMTGLTIHGNLVSTTVGERNLAMEHLEYFKPHKNAEDIIIFDRGYPSKPLIKYLIDNGFQFLMRLQSSFNAEIDCTAENDFFVNFNIKHKDYKVRVIKLVLKSGETEVLITNLDKSKFHQSEFYELYHLRWGVETKYNTLKNKLDIEAFSGKTLITVLQDFYATLYLSNISAAIKAESDEMIREENQSKNLKYEYITNENILIGNLKNRLILIMLNEDSEQRGLLINKLISRISHYRTAVVPDRNFKRPSTSHKRACCRIKKAL